MLLIGLYPFVSSQAQDLDTPFGGLVSLALIIFDSDNWNFLLYLCLLSLSYTVTWNFLNL